MKYKVGDRVKVKSLQWFNENSDDDYNVVLAGGWYFSKPMSILCGKELIIDKISHVTNPPYYIMEDNVFAWTDEMIEGLVEEETSLCEGCCSLELKYNKLTIADNICTDKVEIILQDYELKKEGDKWFAEKKKKEYPKTYEECCYVLGIDVRDVDILDNMLDTSEMVYRKNLDRLLNSFRKLLICRDAYWKIAGEEMGLGKPWEPDLLDDNQDKFALANWDNTIENSDYAINKNYILTLPTEEMRDTFKENFTELIEQCKELL